MPKLIHKLPVPRPHKGRARIRIDGQEIYLGPWGSKEAQEAADKVIANWLARSRQPVPKVAGVTVAEVLAAWWKHSIVYYRHPDGSQTGEAKNFADALRPLRRAYGDSPVTIFGPAELVALREQMIAAKLSRQVINARINRIRRVWKWAVAQGTVPAERYHALATVAGLREGRSAARESKGIKPVPLEDIQATLPFLPSPVAAMVKLQLSTGCRPGEVVSMRPMDIRTDGEVWVYSPERHKNSHRGKTRTIFLGPQAQEIITPFLHGRAPTTYIFSPREAFFESHAKRRVSRKSKPTPSELKRRERAKPGLRYGLRYDRRGYLQTIVKACDRAGVTPWCPLQLRHTRATELRKLFGLEGAQAVLGHAKVETTQIYAERSEERAREIARLVG